MPGTAMTSANPAPSPSLSSDEGPPAKPKERVRVPSKSYGKILLETALITLGVFLGLLGNEWREGVAQSRLADDALRRIRSEFALNRDAVAAVNGKHVESLEKIQAYFAADVPVRSTMSYPYMSTNPAFLEYTGWDLAIATQALSYIDPNLAQEVAHVYAVQRHLDSATRDITLVMYSRAGDADPAPLTRSFATYFGDCALIEPRLLRLYDEILPRLDARLGS